MATRRLIAADGIFEPVKELKSRKTGLTLRAAILRGLQRRAYGAGLAAMGMNHNLRGPLSVVMLADKVDFRFDDGEIFLRSALKYKPASEGGDI